MEIQANPIPTAAKIRVLCVDDSRDITLILGRCIEGEPDMESVGALHAADDLVKQVNERRPDVVLLDMSMPGMDPLVALRELTSGVAGKECEGSGRGGGPVRVIVFSGRSDQAAAELAAEAGACGFLCKDAGVGEILGAIREVARGPVGFRVWR